MPDNDEGKISKNAVIIFLTTFIFALTIILGILLYPMLIGREWDKGYNACLRAYANKLNGIVVPKEEGK